VSSLKLDQLNGFTTVVADTDLGAIARLKDATTNAPAASPQCRAMNY
jgi:hypothetical protein